MSKPALQSVAIECFRGCIEPFTLNFEKGKAITLIYGENGSGKSTICDALELLASGRIGSLDNRGLGSRTERFLKTVAKKSGDPVVELKCAGCRCKVTSRKQLEWSHEATPHVVACHQKRPRVLVLRRAQILDLITAQASDRYEAIERFVNVESVETCEEALDALIKTLRTEQEGNSIRLRTTLESMRKVLGLQDQNDDREVEHARREAARDFAADDELVKANELLGTAFRRMEVHLGIWKQCSDALEAADEGARLAKEALETASQSVSSDASNLVEILEKAASFLDSNSTPSQCPLCESAENVAGLAERVRTRIACFKLLRNSKSLLEQATRKHEEAKAALDRAAAAYARNREEFERTVLEVSAIPKILMPTPCPVELGAFECWYSTNAGLLENWKTCSNEVVLAKFRANEIKRHLAAYDESRTAPASLDSMIPRLEKALAITREERKAFIDSILSGIAQEVGRLYESVHPGEGLDKISLQLNPKKRASLDLGAEFLGQDVIPQAYFSESHLDTLGLCIFLALAKMECADETILIIDDVLASVDEPHVDRLIGMVSVETETFRHCIITTHYRPWREKYRWGWLANGQCNFVELGHWSKTTGLCTARSLSDVERLGTLLGEGTPDPQAVAAKAGVVLEALLSFITHTYECRVPHKPDDRLTVSDLLNGITKKLRAALRVEVKFTDELGKSSYQSSSLGWILDELTTKYQSRNVFGAHFNRLSFELPEADAIHFARLVHKFATTLTDPDTGWPKNRKSGSYWATAGETRRLHPLIEPS